MISIQSKSPNTPYYQYQDAPACTNSIPDPFGLGLEHAVSHAIIGAPDEVSMAGSAYIYEQDFYGSWNKSHELISSDREANDLFGWSVATAGNYAVVTAPHEDHDALGTSPINSAGSAYLFEKGANGNWKEKQKIVASDRAANMQFGISVAISEEYLIVGANEKVEREGSAQTESAENAVYIFENGDNGKWEEVQKIVPTDDGVGDGFGYLVAINGDHAIVGTRGGQSEASGGEGLFDAEAVYIYERKSNGEWLELQKIMNPRKAFLWLEKLY